MVMKALLTLLNIFQNNGYPNSRKHVVQNFEQLSGKEHNRKEGWNWQKRSEIDTSEDQEVGESCNGQKWCLPSKAGSKIWHT